MAKKYLQVRAAPPTVGLAVSPVLGVALLVVVYFLMAMKVSASEPQIGGPVFKVTVKQTKGVPSEIKIQEGDKEATTFKVDPDNPRKAMADFAKYLKDDAERRNAEKSKLPKIDFEFDDGVLYVYVMKLIDDSKIAGYDLVGVGGLSNTNKATSARAADIVYVNILFPEKQGVNSIIDYSFGSSRIVMKSVKRLTEELRRGLKADRKKEDPDAEEAKDIVIRVRADNRVEFKAVSEVLTAIRAAGFSEIQLRALKP
jgi:biopolymer transport protein ExbD